MTTNTNNTNALFRHKPHRTHTMTFAELLVLIILNPPWGIVVKVCHALLVKNINFK